MEKLEIAIIGAGWHGLAMAKTYLEACPGSTMAIFDSAASVGGVWANERLYTGLKTNNLVGTFEFSDFPMAFDRFGVEPGQHIPGQVVHNYLTQVAEHFDLISKTRLSQKVESAELLDDGSWLLQIASTKPEQSSPETQTIVARKLVVATGLTSEPSMPKFEGQESFNRPLFHAKELKDRSSELEKAKHIVVLGGNKSAWDTCFFAAKAGAHVHMVMRPGGGGPSWVWPVLFSPFKVSIQRLAATRFFTWFDPCIWGEKKGPVGWVRYALHETFFGRKVVSKFWNLLEGFAEKAHGYNEHPETQKLKPWVNPFWMGNSLSIHNYSSPWFDLVREGKITVHISDITHLSDGSVHLSDETALGVDAFVCCTGWKTHPPIEFLPKEVAPVLGIRSVSIEDEYLVDKARVEIFSSLPAVREAPRRTLPPGTPTPTLDPSNSTAKVSSGYRLYRFLVPSNGEMFIKRNIAFIGSHLALHAVMIAQLQALWITAFFMDEISNLDSDTPNLDKIQYETILHSEYSRIRHPHAAGGAGDRCPDLAFDCLPYMDLLVDDLGLKKYRKSGILSEIFHRYGPKDYQGMVGEWLDQRKKLAGKA